MRRDDASFLLDMLVAARDAVAFAAGLSFSEFARDQRTQLAILKSVEIVGMRNRLVHAYFEIDLRLVWDTVVDDLPALISQLEPLVPSDDR